MENIQNILDYIVSFINEKVFSNLFGLLNDILPYIVNISSSLFELEWVRCALYFFHLLGIAFFVSGLSIAIYNIATDYISYHSLSFKKHILPIFLGYFYTSLFTVIPPLLYSFCTDLQKSFAKDLIAILTGKDMSFSDITKSALDTIINVFSRGYTLSIAYVLIILYTIFKVFISTIKRGGVLLTMIAVGSLYTFSISYAGFDAFFKWAKQIIALCVTAFLQTTLLTLGLMTFSFNALLGLGIMLSAGEVNKVAGQFGLDVSARDSFNSFKQTTFDIIRTGKMLTAI